MKHKKKSIKEWAQEYGVSEKFVRTVNRFIRKNDEALRRLAQR